VAAAAPAGRRHLVCSAIEHKCVLEVCKGLEAQGWRLTVMPVQRDGRIDLGLLSQVVSEETAVVSIMVANNEIGTVQPMKEIAAIAHAKGALVHTDAAQAVGKIAVDVNAMGIDLLSLTGHKMYGPKGCGALYVRRKTPITSLIVGGGQERGFRSGTLNVPGIVGLGHACHLDRLEMQEETARLRRMRDRLLEGLQTRAGGVIVNGSIEHRLPHNLHVAFEGVDGESLIIGIGDIAVSSGSACSSASNTPSHVLTALLSGAPVPGATVRFGLGRFTTDADIDYAIEKFATVVSRLRPSVSARA